LELLDVPENDDLLSHGMLIRVAVLGVSSVV